MDNITHAFVGVAMAECALPRSAAAGTRLAFMCAGIAAANAPDIDLFYTSITEEPLGYLLHHRGHSHTVPGMAVLGLLICAALFLWPRARRAIDGAEQRWVFLIAAALVSHLLMDTGNSYGTHLFYPLSSRWVYGDAVFVLEPWLWAMLGGTLALNAGRRWRVVVSLLTLALIGALIALGVLQPLVAAAMLAVVGAALFMMRAWDRRRRAAGVLFATAAVFLLMSGVSRAAKSEARQAAAALNGGEIVDVVADANPGAPWCWTVLTLQKTHGGTTDALSARRATLSLLPGIWPAPSCASARLGARWSSDIAPSEKIVWHRHWRIDGDELRALFAGNCRVRAWLQFGRVPYVAGGRIVDLRFENPIGQNFTPMAVEGGEPGCPAYLTNWQVPRRELLAYPADRP